MAGWEEAACFQHPVKRDLRAVLRERQGAE